MIYNVKPIFGINYFPGDDMFSHDDGSIISDGIAFIESLEEAGEFKPSHCWKVMDDDTGIEASTEGVSFFPLSKYFDDPSYIIVSRTPQDIDDYTIREMEGIAVHLNAFHEGYDYTGLIGDSIEAMLFLDEIFPFLKKIPSPFHWPGHLFCSALVSTINKGTTKYKDAQLFQEYDVTKISPLALFNQFPYKPLEVKA